MIQGPHRDQRNFVRTTEVQLGPKQQKQASQKKTSHSKHPSSLYSVVRAIHYSSTMHGAFHLGGTIHPRMVSSNGGRRGSSSSSSIKTRSLSRSSCQTSACFSDYPGSLMGDMQRPGSTHSLRSGARKCPGFSFLASALGWGIIARKLYDLAKGSPRESKDHNSVESEEQGNSLGSEKEDYSGKSRVRDMAKLRIIPHGPMCRSRRLVTARLGLPCVSWVLGESKLPRSPSRNHQRLETQDQGSPRGCCNPGRKLGPLE